jgi:hypothetical protein
MNIKKIVKVPLRELWKKEAQDFTPWLSDNIDYLIEVLGFDINIESIEQSVGPFKVDIYGEDGSGNKLIIENQLEKTDHTHLGQIITYLVNLEIKTAIWITSRAVEEHQKAIDWLNEVTPDDISFYLIQLEAIRIGDDESAGPLFTIVKKPSFLGKKIGAQKKEYAQRHFIRERFWEQFIEFSNSKNSLFNTISPSKDHWIRIGVGMSGLNLNLVVTQKYARVEIYILADDQNENKKIFDFFYNQKNLIESEMNSNLIWERMDDKKSSRIKLEINDVNVFNEEDWSIMNQFLVENVVKFQKVFKKQAGILKKQI